MPEEGEGGHAEGALRWIYLQSRALQDLKNQAEIPHVFGKVLAGDQNVVEVHEHKREGGGRVFPSDVEMSVPRFSGQRA